MVLKTKDKGIHIANLIFKLVPNLVNQIQIVEKTGELRILTDSSKINNLLTFLKNHTMLNFHALQDLFAIDYLDYSFSLSKIKSSNLNNFTNVNNKMGICICDYELNKDERFQVNYYVLSLPYEMRILIKVNLKNLSFIDSVSNIYNSASWLEREIWDLFGIFFKNHPDLRRILTDYGFEGYALRKDFPLSGYTEIMYTTELKKITVKPLELTQEYRAFDFVSPWDIKKI